MEQTTRHGAIEGKAESEYEVFRKQQDVDYISGFDKEIKRLEGE